MSADKLKKTALWKMNKFLAKLLMNTKVPSRSTLDPEQNYNPNLLDFATYKNNLSNPAQPKVPNLVDYEILTQHVYVSSADRDITAYHDAGTFQVAVDFREVTSVSLVGGVVPNISGVATQPYLILSIPEINHVESLGTMRGVASIIQFANHVSTDTFFNIDGRISGVSPREYKPVKSKLSTLTVNLLNANGTPVVLGTGISPANQLLLQFRVNTRIRNKSVLYSDFRDV